VFDEEQDDASREKEEDVLGERVRGPDVSHRVDDRRDDQEGEGGGDRVPRIEAGPDRVPEIDDQKPDENGSVREVHPFPAESGEGLLSAVFRPRASPIPR
jgi:hypothetical protein